MRVQGFAHSAACARRVLSALALLVAAVGANVHGAAPARQPQAPPKSADAPASEAQLAALRRALNAVVALRVSATEGASTSRSLGQERSGSGVVIDGDGLILTIGYLLLEAQTIEVVTQDERRLPARQVAYDQATGFGLVQPLIPLRPQVEPAPMSSAASPAATSPFLRPSSSSARSAAILVS